MTDLDDFMPEAMVYAPNAPEPLVQRCLREAATRFCERTRLWRSTATIVTNGQQAEIIPPPADGQVYEVLSCSIFDSWIDDEDDDGDDGGDNDNDETIETCTESRPLWPKSLDWLSKHRPDWRVETVSAGVARWYVCPDFGLIQPVPRTMGNLFVEFAVKPTAAATTLPDFMFNMYAEVIGIGAAAKILSVPDKSFANPDLAVALASMFDRRLGGLAASGFAGQQQAPARSRGRFM